MNLKKFLLSALAVGGICLTGCSNNDNNNEGEDDNPPSVVKYRNPIINADVPDPSVVRDGDTLYLFGTGGRVYKNSDLKEDWEQLPDVKRSIPWGDSFTSIWAPDVVKIGDTWNYYYSVSLWGGNETAGIGVMTSTSLEGPWVDKGKIFDSPEIGVVNSIDPCVIEADGKVFMFWGSFQGLFMVELNEDGTALKNPETAKEDKKLIAGIVGPWDGATYEGLYVRKINDYYYMFASQGTCCDGINSSYHVKVARSKSIYGPYVDSEGVDMCGKDRGELVVKGNQNVAGPGHNSLLQDDNGDWWIFYHGYDKNAPSGRFVFMDKLLWDDNGFPYVQSRVPSYNKNIKGPVLNKKIEE